MSKKNHLEQIFSSTVEVAGNNSISARSAAPLPASALPWSVPPDEPTFWGRDDPTIRQLAQEFVAGQASNAGLLGAALTQLASEDAFRQALDDASALPPQVVGRILRPDGLPGGRLQLTFAQGLAPADSLTATAFTAEDGSFVLPIPQALRVAGTAARDMTVTGGNGSHTVANAFAPLQPNGYLPPITLPQALDPLPLALLGRLEQLVADASALTRPAAPDHATPAVTIGEDQCEIVFRNDASQDRFPFAAMFRLTDPALSQPTLVYRLGGETETDVRVPFYGLVSPTRALLGPEAPLEMHLAERVPIDRPLSVDAFRDGLAHVTPGWWNGVPIAGSLAIGYVVQMAQRWTPLGLALGDLTYSLPLAPGEQQRIAIVERTATSTVIDTETLDQTEQISFSEQDDTSATATFSSALREAASGGTHYDTDASSWSVGGGIGGAIAAGAALLAGGVAGGYGSGSANGNTDTWMSGARSSTSNTAERTHTSTQRQAAARRHSSRAAMRMATASESDSVVTKVITNHNKTRALTMQYWEVLRMFDVSTVVEGVTLVCLIPLDVVRFLPPGQPRDLQQAPEDRPSVLARYGQLLTHADMLSRVLPPRYRQGLALITEFAADPSATTVQTGADPAEDVLGFTLSGSFLPIEDVFVTVVSKRGLRAGPVPLSAAAATMPPIPGMTQSDRQNAYATEEELFGELRARRAGTAAVELRGEFVLPASIPRQDVVGFEISRRFYRLDYHFLPPAVNDVSLAQARLGGISGDLISALVGTVHQPSRTASYQPDRLDAELGGPRLSSFAALIPPPSNPQAAQTDSPPAPNVVFAKATWGQMLELSRNPLPVSSRVIPPVLGYSAVLEIEKTLQWTIRNTMTCSMAVFSALTPEERVVLLERYDIEVPAKDTKEKPVTVSVPLLSCISNNVLGYYGNAMVLPFQIPVAVTEATTDRKDGAVVKAGLTTGDIQAALTRFHTDGFDPPRAVIALPTKGVLGEAVLGHCSSAEKIDLLRFWNWQDSPGDEATQISPVAVPSSSLTAGLAAPSDLTHLNPIITNFNTSAAVPGTSLAEALAKAAAEQKPFDVAALTNAAQLETLTVKTLDTAETARKDALAQATTLATKAMDAAANLAKAAKKDASGGKDPKSPGDTFPGSDTKHPLSIYFNLDDSTVVDSTTEGTGSGQLAALDAFVAKAQEVHASAVTVRGFAGQEGDAQHNTELAQHRADAVKANLQSRLPAGTTITATKGGTTHSGTVPKLRRADVVITARKQK
jgi:outer membrane protein OmpA-like peptidoglycan-associated protein